MSLSPLVQRELAKGAISRKLTSEFDGWRKEQLKKVGTVTPGMEKHYYRERLIEALLKMQRRFAETPK